MAADLVVEAVAEAGPERSRVEQLEGLGGGHPGSKFQLEPKQGPLHLPLLRLLQGGGNGVHQELHPDLRHVPGGLHWVQGVLPALVHLEIVTDQLQLETF